MQAKAKIVKVIKSKEKDGIKQLQVEALENDVQEHYSYTMPGFESIALPDDKTMLMPLDKKGKYALLAIPLKTSIKDGEIKINCRSIDGSLKGSIYLKEDGSVELGIKNFKAVILETFQTIFNSHTHPDPTSGTTGPPTAVMTSQHISKKVKVE